MTKSKYFTGWRGLLIISAIIIACCLFLALIGSIITPKFLSQSGSGTATFTPGDSPNNSSNELFNLKEDLSKNECTKNDKYKNS